MLCNRCITRLEKPICPVCREPIFPGRPPPADHATGGAQSESSDMSSQIQEDAQLARRLSLEMGRGDGGTAAEEPLPATQAHSLPANEATPLTSMAEAQQFHHIGSRMTYATF